MSAPSRPPPPLPPPRAPLTRAADESLGIQQNSQISHNVEKIKRYKYKEPREDERTVDLQLDESLAIAVEEGVVENRYDISDFLGDGGFSEVYKARERASGREVALKIAYKAAAFDFDPGALSREISFLKECQSEWVVGFFGAFDAPRSVYLSLELLDGGPLLEIVGHESEYSLKSRRELSLQPKDLEGLVVSMLRAVEFVHGKGIIHRDIQPQNFAFTSKTPNRFEANLKLIDFGLSIRVDSRGRASGWVGSPNFQAPEMRDPNGYDNKVDLWGVGMIAFVLVEGYLPFHDRNPLKLSLNVQTLEIEFQEKYWQSFGRVLNVVQRLLNRNSALRPSAEQALSDLGVA